MNRSSTNNSFESILKEEVHHIQQKPGKKDTTEDNLVGLSLSGGGIRSASFGLGVIHGLVANDKLKKIDYLSTVSGGGYIGSALTWALHYNKDQGETILSKENFPLGQIGNGSKNSKVNNFLNFIRQQVNYSNPGQGLSPLSMTAMFVRGSIVSILVYAPLIALFLYLTKPWEYSNIYLASILGLGIAFISFSIIFSIGTYLAYRFYFDPSKAKSTTLSYKLRNFSQKVVGKLLIITAAMAILYSLKPATDFLNLKFQVLSTASLSTIVAYAILLAKQYLQSNKPSNSTGFSRLASMIVDIFFNCVTIYALLICAYILAQFYPAFLWGSLCVSMIVGYFANINIISNSRSYRDRLMETFMPDPESIKTMRWNPAFLASHTSITSMCDTQTPGPYHLYCAAVCLKNSLDSRIKGRSGDCFILSPLFCGSASTGWQKSSKFMNGKLHASTAMGISAAALSPNWGTASPKGSFITALAAFIEAFFNSRLGYWTPNPNHKRASKKGWVPNFFFPGLQDVFGYGYTENSAFLELSDGGHFENLAAYEMIRRKVKTLIISDAGCDPAQAFEDLASLVEKARVDFGVNILFDDPDYDLQSMIPGSGKTSPFNTLYGVAKRGFAIGTIYYPNGTQGKLFFLKETMTDELPVDIYAYKSGAPDFPNETTADQFFSEQQFEAYRELGYRISSSLFKNLDDQWNLTSRAHD